MNILKIHNGNNAYILSGITNWAVTHRPDGTKTLEFNIDPNSEYYQLIAEETRLEYNDIYYNIKKINERKNTSSITAELDLDSLKGKVWWQGFTRETVTLGTVLSEILNGTGWTYACTDFPSTSPLHTALFNTGRTITLEEDPNILDILDYTQNSTAYNARYRFDNKNKTLYVSNADFYEDTNVYFTDELNLTEPPEMKGSTENFYTRIYPFGRDDINLSTPQSDKKYIDVSDLGEDYIYKPGVCISVVWRDERYTNIDSLRSAAIKKLKAACFPERSYTCKLIDLAKIDPVRYSFLAFSVYNSITLMDRRRKYKIKYNISEYKEYPDEPSRNTVVLGNKLKTYKGLNDSMKKSIYQAEYVIREKTRNQNSN